MNLPKKLFLKISFYIAFVGLLVWKGMKWVFGTIVKNGNLWSGLFPAVVLGLIAYFGLKQTNKELKILQEQISYQRTPVVHVFANPRLTGNGRFGDDNLSVANIGNDTLENFALRLGLFLINDSVIYSYGQFQDLPVEFLDTLRKPKEKQWPHLMLPPNSERDFTSYLHFLLRNPFLTKWKEDEKEIREELFSIKELFKGEYVLFAECSYRRKSDFVQYKDTTYFHYDPSPAGIHQDLKLEIGGYKAINRLRRYMTDGPELSINIKSDRYEVYEKAFGSFWKTVKIIPREKVKK